MQKIYGYKEHKIETDKVNAIISAISNVRITNNVNWMDLLRIAVKYAPKNEVLAILKGIDTADVEIGNRFKTLIVEMEKED